MGGGERLLSGELNPYKTLTLQDPVITQQGGNENERELSQGRGVTAQQEKYFSGQNLGPHLQDNPVMQPSRKRPSNPTSLLEPRPAQARPRPPACSRCKDLIPL